MTTEDDFNWTLDANPAGWQVRLVFADWLEENGDLRAEGYRALGRRRKQPHLDSGIGWAFYRLLSGHRPTAADLPPDWRGGFQNASGNGTYPSRREAEDAAALAFAKLPAARRTELLVEE